VVTTLCVFLSDSLEMLPNTSQLFIFNFERWPPVSERGYETTFTVQLTRRVIISLPMRLYPTMAAIAFGLQVLGRATLLFQ